MKIIWLGHSGFRIEIEEAVLLIDPWLDGNPMFPADRRAEALEGATHVLLTHGHGDHAGSAAAICKEKGLPLVGIYDLVSWYQAREGVEALGFNKGGTVTLGGAQVTMVNASHSSSVAGPDGPVATGSEAGFMIAGEGHTIYVSGDTDIMADMAWMARTAPARHRHPLGGRTLHDGHGTRRLGRAEVFQLHHRHPLPLPHLLGAGAERRCAAPWPAPGHHRDRTRGAGGDHHLIAGP